MRMGMLNPSRINSLSQMHRKEYEKLKGIKDVWIVITQVSVFEYLHSKKRTICSGLMKTALNNVLLPTLFKVVNNIVQQCYT